MKKHIPNILTCCNLFFGCVSIVMALRGNLEAASLLLFLCAIFDFLDGFAARMLKVKSDIGVDMDSLADVFSFGGAPAMILFVWLERCLTNLPPYLQEMSIIQLLPFVAFIVPGFSAVRLARFNHDERQVNEFHGLPTPANALFIGFLHYSASTIPFLTNLWVVLALTIVFSLLLVTDIPMFSLKFKNLNFKENYVRYIFLFIALILIIIFKLGAFPIIILSYILLSFVMNLIQK
ncbi:CDP-alcohol phosphatidyltransferase family protein [Bacteroidales bacterium OttesenSCG-928-B11]|nr:CDP-alcohol phosphatidyltransferase family protein [Bacteroidales bacterium OttesenSCG-928-E04]MDL2312344.1 CDP-alcohol phosphatidyltransferase family protein [Bacteroidales bacterium OttesenSCG-928-B11]MDL2326290.1 CDP-alcohol phosphatidyltransferase family protein [Bacteroidales bacterium OttesenSCG-928-A14]